MSWTDSDTIKKHLFDLDKLPTQFADVPVALSATSIGSLPHKAIVAGSDRVKRIAELEPVSQSSVTLTAEVWMPLSYDNLKPGEIAVAADDGLAIIYRLGLDYAVDFAAGRIRRISGGDISSGQAVQVYYLRYQVMTRLTDYAINNTTGEITLLPQGNLEPDTTIWVDYQVTAASGADQLISEAITQSENKILSRLKEGYTTQSTDQGLKTGATELTLASVCRALATRALSDGQPSAEGRAKGWRDLADQYSAASWQTLKPFLAPPMMRAIGKQANTSWEWK